MALGPLLSMSMSGPPLPERHAARQPIAHSDAPRNRRVAADPCRFGVRHHHSPRGGGGTRGVMTTTRRRPTRQPTPQLASPSGNSGDSAQPTNQPWPTNFVGCWWLVGITSAFFGVVASCWTARLLVGEPKCIHILPQLKLQRTRLPPFRHGRPTKIGTRMTRKTVESVQLV